MFFLKKKGPCLGVDAVEIKRFTLILESEKNDFIEKVFSKKEIAYCESFKDKATHYAGFFAAKEAISKALGVNKYPFIEIEISHTKEGAPFALYKGKKLLVTVSITHTEETAIAVAIL